LAKGKAAFPYSKPPESSLIAALGSGRFLSEHPEVSLLLDEPRIVEGKQVRTERVATEPFIRRHLKLLSDFITLHPDFPLRDKLEMMLGFDTLALGTADEAASHWRWVTEHSSNRDLSESARRNLDEMAQLGLISATEGGDRKFVSHTLSAARG
jgi:hypothetical protein